MLGHAEEYFSEWMESWDGFFDSAAYNQSKGRHKIAAFELHQTAERYITCLLLVHTGYKPKEHDLEKLLAQEAGFHPAFATIFPRNTGSEARIFDLLRRAYVDARYSRNYCITEDELGLIRKRLEALRMATEDVCRRRIAELVGAVEATGKT